MRKKLHVIHGPLLAPYAKFDPNWTKKKENYDINNLKEERKNLKRIMVRDGMVRGRGLMMKRRGFMFLLYIY